MAVKLISKRSVKRTTSTQQKVLCQFAWTRVGLLRFTRQLETDLEDGWRIRHLSFGTGLFGVRWLCRAVLFRRPRGQANGTIR